MEPWVDELERYAALGAVARGPGQAVPRRRHLGRERDRLLRVGRRRPGPAAEGAGSGQAEHGAGRRRSAASGWPRRRSGRPIAPCPTCSGSPSAIAPCWSWATRSASCPRSRSGDSRGPSAGWARRRWSRSRPTIPRPASSRTSTTSTAAARRSAGSSCSRPAAIHVFHFNDYPANPPREKLTDADRVYPGDGVAPLQTLLRDLAEGGFQVMLSLELFNRQYWSQDPLTVARTGFEKMNALVQSVRRRMSSGRVTRRVRRETGGPRRGRPLASVVAIYRSIAARPLGRSGRSWSRGSGSLGLLVLVTRERTAAGSWSPWDAGVHLTTFAVLGADVLGWLRRAWPACARRAWPGGVLGRLLGVVDRRVRVLGGFFFVGTGPVPAPVIGVDRDRSGRRGRGAGRRRRRRGGVTGVGVGLASGTASGSRCAGGVPIWSTTLSL